MSILQAIFLGFIQGVTEFLPISSSAHLVIFPYMFGWKFPAEQSFIFNVLVQLGTLAALIVYFAKDLWNILSAFFKGIFTGKPFAEQQARLGWYLILATVPAGLLGLAVKKIVENAFDSPIATAVFLILTAGLLFLAEWQGKRVRTLETLTWLDALVIGCFQALSIFPGVSRSGATITGGMLRGMERAAAARFSFLMSIPVMLAAGLLETLDLLELPGLGAFLPTVLAGTLTAAVIGFVAIHWLLKYLQTRSLSIFAIYCLIASAVTLGFTFWIR